MRALRGNTTLVFLRRQPRWSILLLTIISVFSPFTDEHQHREGIPWAGRGDLGQEQRTRDEACVGPFEPACPAWRLSWVLPVACYKDGCQQCLEGDHSLIRPWLKKCLVICRGLVVFYFRFLSLKVCLYWCLVYQWSAFRASGVLTTVGVYWICTSAIPPLSASLASSITQLQHNCGLRTEFRQRNFVMSRMIKALHWAVFIHL